MKMVRSILTNMALRFLVGLVLVIAGGLLIPVFPPMGILAFAGMLMVLCMGSENIVTYHQTDATIPCSHCGEQPAQIIRVTHRIFPWLPLVGWFLALFFFWIRIPVAQDYYLICPQCKDREQPANDATYMLLLQGGMVTAKPLTKEEAKNLIKK